MQITYGLKLVMTGQKNAYDRAVESVFAALGEGNPLIALALEGQQTDANGNVRYLFRVDNIPGAPVWVEVSAATGEVIAQVKEPEAWLTGQSSAEEKAAENLEDAISSAILAHNRREAPDGLLHVESHILLANEETSGTPLFGKHDHVREVTAYVLYMHERYAVSGGKLSAQGGSFVPAAITFTVTQQGEYVLKEFWQPRDGSYYASDIRAKFPGTAAEDALDSQKYVHKLTESCSTKALERLLGLSSRGIMDSAVFDIDGDGEDELCTLSYGATSGLFSFCLSVASAAPGEGQLELFQTYLYSLPGKLSFEAGADGAMRIKAEPFDRESETEYIDVCVNEGTVYLLGNGLYGAF